MNWLFWLWVIATVLVVAAIAFPAHKARSGGVPEGFKGNREELVSKFRRSLLRTSVVFLVGGAFTAARFFLGAPSASKVAQFVFFAAGVGSSLLAYWYLRTVGSTPATPAADPEGPAQPTDI